MREEINYENLSVNEIKANLSYLDEKITKVSDSLERLLELQANHEKYGLDRDIFNSVIDYLSADLLGAMTEREVHQSDFDKELWLAKLSYKDIKWQSQKN